MTDQKMKDLNKRLAEIGVSTKGLHKAEIALLSTMLHPDEVVLGAIYGFFTESLIAMMVATDKRVLFIDKRPLSVVTDEISYFVVSGIKITDSALGMGVTVTLHTRIGDYTLSMVNRKNARQFREAVEARSIETEGGQSEFIPATKSEKKTDDSFGESTINLQSDKQASDFLKKNETGVISSVDRTGNVAGAVVYYAVDAVGNLYLITSKKSNKAQNIYYHPQVALTVFDEQTLETVQLQGHVEAIDDAGAKMVIYKALVKERKYKEKTSFPPVSKVKSDDLVFMKISPYWVSYNKYI